MKHLKILSLLAVAAAALMAFAATASATTITSSTGETPTIKASAEGHVILDNPIAEISCASSVEGTVEKDKEKDSEGNTLPASGEISALSFTNCTNSWHVTVVANGSLSVSPAGSGNGSLKSSGATVEATRFGIACRYSTNNTAIGTVTTAEHATLDISAAIPFHNGSGLCGSGATTWTGSYKVTHPTNLVVE